MKSFTFLVLSYNHEKYILEHLESIKFLIENYGKEVLVDIIIADDFSKDNTLDFAKIWLNENSNLFRKIIIPEKQTNLGTCKNLTTALEYVDSDYCKITASDDVYSNENLFLEFSKIDGYDMISGLPLNLLEGTINETKFDLFNIIATNIIYKNTNYNQRLKRINFFNAPSIVYSKKSLKNSEIIEFINQFRVTEDYPLQIKMSEVFSPLKFKQINKIFIYYRRTLNSTYIVKNTVFDQDKLDIFDYLIAEEKNPFYKLLIKNRKFVYMINNKYFKKLLNVNFYLYGLQIFLNYFKISKEFKQLNKEIEVHQEHYDKIVLNAKNFCKKHQLT